MTSLVDSDVQPLVARLVLGYLENQQLQGTYKSFFDSSRHLSKEKKGLKYGDKLLETSAGLVNIIKEYFMFKARISEFLRTSPQSPVIIQLIDSEDTLERLKIILSNLKESLSRSTDENQKKRKLEINEVFDISQSNTSTPETVNPPKRIRKSLTTPFLTLSGNKEIKTKSVEKSITNRAELNYRSSSETSEKDDDGEVEGEPAEVKRASMNMTPPVLSTNNELLSETILNKPNLIDRMVDLINETRSGRDMEASTSNSTQENRLTDNDFQNILSNTENDPFFDEIVKDVLNKYLIDQPEAQESAQTSTSSEKVLDTEMIDGSILEEVPIKQRLRPRSEKKTAAAEKKKKFNIISDEVISASAHLIPLPMLSNGIEQNLEAQQHLLINMPVFVQSGDLISVLQPLPPNVSASIECQATTSAAVFCQNSYSVENVQSSCSVAGAIIDKKELTPKTVLYPSFLESKSKSASRHVRILDFNQTPSLSKLSTVPECSTPSNRIPMQTPGSAPASLSIFKSSKRESVLDAVKKVEVQQTKIPESVIDDNSNSNSNSISNTPKVVKDRRRRKIAETKEKNDEKPKNQSHEDELKKPFTHDDWKNMIHQSKTVPIDQQLRMVNQKTKDCESPKKKRGALKRRVSKKSVKKCKSFNKSPDEQKENKTKNVKEEKSSSSIEFDENEPLSTVKFKISSPRKTAAAALKKTPKKKKKSIVEKSREKFEAHEKKKKVETVTSKSLETIPEVKEAEQEVSSELNRSDTVQDVAQMLVTLPETILAADNSTKVLETSIPENEAKSQVDSGIEQNPLLETPSRDLMDLIQTPFKDYSLTPLPNTPRFAIPLSTSSLETPLPKIYPSVSSLESLVKATCDILTPSFPITPGFKETPFKDGIELSPSASGYSRKTDYSSCSSYYKPDESEDINQNINAIINQRRSERTSQSESDGACERPIKVGGSVKKVDCPGAMERVKSFNDEQKDLPAAHYTMMEEGLLSESMITTATDDSSSSSSSSSRSYCSTCSTDPSENENTMDKLCKASKTDSEWDPDDPEMKKKVLDTPAVMNEETGEVRFPIRTWMTPHKAEVARKDDENKTKAPVLTKNQALGISLEEDRERRAKEMEAVKKRMLQNLRTDSAAIKPKSSAPKYKKVNVKNFKLPEDTQVVMPMSRKDQILQQNLTERPRPTPLKLIPSSSSSRRKNATPRKTIVIDQLPCLSTALKKKKTGKSPVKSPSKTERLSLECTEDDNAIMPEETSSFEVSSSFNTSNEEETASTVVANKQTPSKSSVTGEDGSNTFQRTMIAQGFEKSVAQDLQSKLVDSIEDETEKCKEDVQETQKTVEIVNEKPKEEDREENTTKEDQSGSEEEESDEEDEDELELCFSDVLEKNSFNFFESENFKPLKEVEVQVVPPMTIRYDDRTVTMTDSENFELFTMDPVAEQKVVKAKKVSPKKANLDEKKNGKESSNKTTKESTNKKSRNVKDSPNKNGKSKQGKKTEPAKSPASSSTKKPKLNITSKDKNKKTEFNISAILDELHGK